ncbi:MAG: T9SS type A sorting domain-containing protein [Candidatus Eisenbacteria sp.]|nr:T9SS type A sorting domain-containing protein [Candidatus Eisenbacteria bacterium]
MQHTRLLPVAVIAALLLAFALPASGTAAEGANEGLLEYTLEFSEHELTFENAKGFDLVSMDETTFLSTPGHPMLPVRQIKIALPSGLVATGVRVLAVERVELPGRFLVYPAQPARAGSDPSAKPFVDPIADIYASSEVYPSAVVSFVHQTDLAGQGIAVLDVTPLQYVPVTGRLSMTTSLTIGIEHETGHLYGDYLPQNAAPKLRARYEERIAQMVVNPEDVIVASAPLMRGTRGVDPGQYDLVIITDPYLEWAFEPLVEWKTKKGVPTKVVTTSWIYYTGGYPGPEQTDQIRQFVEDAHATWGATFFLLGGNQYKVPVNYWDTPTGMNPPVLPEDVYYADYDDDWTLEVNVGRWPIGYSSEVTAHVNKVLTYEKTPPLTDYAARLGLFGFDLDASTHGEECKEYIDSQYIPGHMDVVKIYDSHDGNHADSAIVAIDSGLHLINHIDHCNTVGLGMGSVNHGWSITGADVLNFVNGDRQCIIYSTGCYVGAFDNIDCISTDFVNEFDNGAIAFICNTRYGWFNPGLCTTLSNLWDRRFWGQLFNQEKYTLGECFSDHKDVVFLTSNTHRYIYKELTLFGDPELPLWTDDPADLVVTHDATIETGGATLDVHVEDSGGGALEEVRVCLWKGDEVYLVDYTGVTGDVTFNPNATTEGTLYVTATVHNYLPYEGETAVLDPADVAEDAVVPTVLRLHPNRPSPFRTTTTIAYDLPAESRVSLRIYDLTGRVMRSLVDDRMQVQGSHEVVWDGRDDAGRPVASGVYLYRMESDEQQLTRRMLMLR